MYRLHLYRALFATIRTLADHLRWPSHRIKVQFLFIGSLNPRLNACVWCSFISQFCFITWEPLFMSKFHLIWFYSARSFHQNRLFSHQYTSNINSNMTASTDTDFNVRHTRHSFSSSTYFYMRTPSFYWNWVFIFLGFNLLQSVSIRLISRRKMGQNVAEMNWIFMFAIWSIRL